MRIWLEGWEDGEPVKSCLEAPDRWQVQAAERVTVEVAPEQLVIVQQQLHVHAALQPRSLTAARLGVGACLWDGALVLTAYLASQPAATFAGMRCIEMGAGVGLVGLTLAKLGATVTLTDKSALLGLLRGNVAKNWLGDRPRPGIDPQQQRGKADVAALEWGKGDCMNTVTDLASRPIDLVVATDCTYIDPDGNTPDVQAFMEACAGLCQAKSKCLVTYEDRGTALRNAFFTAACARFTQVKPINRQTLPEGYRLEHIDLWELRL